MTDIKLPQAMSELRPALKNIVDQGRERAPYFSALLSNKYGLTITVDNREERIIEQTPSAGTILTAFDGVTMYERAICGFAQDDIRRAVRDLVQSTRFENYIPRDEDQHHGDFVTSMQVDPLDLSIKEKLERCRDLQRRTNGRDSRIVNVRVRYVESGEQSVFVNLSADLAQRIQRVNLTLIVIVAGTDGEVRYDWRSKSGGAGWEALSFSDEEIQSLVDSAIALLSAERIEPGEYQVITTPGVSGVLCHESFGHGVETDMFLKERAQATRFIDKVVGSPLVNIYDDPSLPGSYGSYFFDDEGCMASPTQIVEEGIFRRGITDFHSAVALDIPRSANGRRQDYSRKAYARMSTTYFDAGASTLDGMLAQIDHGVYLDQCSSGMEDPKGWGIQVTCHYGYEIKGGKITNRMFAPIGVSGYVPEVLQNISAVGADLGFDGGFCGKGHKEIVPVASGGPLIAMKVSLG